MAQWGQRYTALHVQVVRQLPPLTYTLALRGLRPGGKTLETYHTGGGEELDITKKPVASLVYMH